MKKIIKKLYLLYFKQIKIDNDSELNINVKTENISKHVNIINSKCHINEIGEGSFIENSFLYGNIVIGKYVSISGPGTVIKSLANEIEIKSHSSIGQNVCIVDFNHPINKISTSFIQYKFFDKDFTNDIGSKGKILIEEDVWIGSNVVITSGVTIGRGSIIAANSFVNKNIPKYSIYGGSPAKFIKKRFTNESIEEIEESKWWTWSIHKIKKNKSIFEKRYV